MVLFGLESSRLFASHVAMGKRFLPLGVLVSSSAQCRQSPGTTMVCGLCGCSPHPASPSLALRGSVGILRALGELPGSRPWALWFHFWFFMSVELLCFLTYSKVSLSFLNHLCRCYKSSRPSDKMKGRDLKTESQSLYPSPCKLSQD